MIVSNDKISGNLLMITNELDTLGDKHAEFIPNEQRKEFVKGVEGIKKDILHIIEVNRKINEVVERAYK